MEYIFDKLFIKTCFNFIKNNLLNLYFIVFYKNTNFFLKNLINFFIFLNFTQMITSLKFNCYRNYFGFNKNHS